MPLVIYLFVQHKCCIRRFLLLRAIYDIKEFLHLKNPSLYLHWIWSTRKVRKTQLLKVIKGATLRKWRLSLYLSFSSSSLTLNHTSQSPNIPIEPLCIHGRQNLKWRRYIIISLTILGKCWFSWWYEVI